MATPTSSSSSSSSSLAPHVIAKRLLEERREELLSSAGVPQKYDSIINIPRKNSISCGHYSGDEFEVNDDDDDYEGVSATTYRVDERYKLVEHLGQGAYGVVIAADDFETGKSVAIKVIDNAFNHIAFTKRTLRELKVLRHLKHDNILGINSIMTFGGVHDFTHVCIVTDLFETDLGAVLKSNQNLTLEQCIFFLYQVLRGVKYFHSAGVVHRDLKPRNLLVNFNCDLKICDFGLSKLILADREGFDMIPMTARSMCTRWYRSPEILCDCKNYGKAADIWSIGCIFAEILTKKPLLPGENNTHQLELTVELTGVPSEEVVKIMGNEKLRQVVHECGGEWLQPMNLMEIFSETLERMGRNYGIKYYYNCEKYPPEVDIMEKMLKFDPSERISVQEALEHELMKNFHQEDDEPVRGLIPVDEFEFERRKVDQPCLRELIHREMLRYYPNEYRIYSESAEFVSDAEIAARCPLLEPGEAFGVDRVGV